MIDPETGEEETFDGWVDPNYKPAPDATPFPACWTTSSRAPSAAARPGVGGSPGASRLAGAAGTVVERERAQHRSS